MADLVDKSVLRRISKCLALSSSSVPGEAAAALEKARELMDKHGVDAQTLRLQNVQEAKVRSCSISRVPRWESRLVALIAQTFQCEVLWQLGWSYAKTADKRHGHYVLMGLSGHVQLAEHAAAVLLRRLRKARMMYKGHRLRAIAFCEGWVDGVIACVRSFARDATTEKIVKEYKDKMHGELPPAKTKTSGTLPAGPYFAGVIEGGQERLFRPIQDAGGTAISYEAPSAAAGARL